MRMPKSNDKRGGGGRGGPSGGGGGGIVDRLLMPRLEQYALNNDYNDIDETVEYMRYAPVLSAVGFTSA
eukprot:5680063-Pyramimonas_sp.AAC.1